MKFYEYLSFSFFNSLTILVKYQKSDFQNFPCSGGQTAILYASNLKNH